MDINEVLSAFTSLGARWVLWLLVALSVAGVAVVIERALYLLTSRDDASRLQDELRALLSRGDAAQARRRLEESPCFEARVAAAGLNSDGPGSAEERKVLEHDASFDRLAHGAPFTPAGERIGFDDEGMVKGFGCRSRWREVHWV